MKKSKLTKLLAAFLVFVFVVGLFPLTANAAVVPSSQAKNFRRTLDEVKEVMNTLTYKEYLDKWGEEPEGTRSYRIDGTAYLPGETTAAVKTETYDGVRALYTPDTGKTTWSVNVSASGLYAIEIEYYPTPAKATSIERTLYIDGKVPFNEARTLSMTKVWEDVYAGEFGVFEVDSLGNDIRPLKIETPEWRKYTATDSTGFYVEPFVFYLSSGEHTITLEAIREPIGVAAINIKPIVHPPTYEEYIAAAKANGAKEATAAPIKIDAENPIKTSELVISPIYDRTSAISDPQDASRIRLNTIGSNARTKGKWSTVGQWIRYEVDVPETGLYQIVLRYHQILLTGMFTSRRILINGEVPFAEASYCQFPFNDAWQTKPLNNGETDFEFYLEKGMNTLEFEVVLGDVSTILNRLNAVLQKLNAAYLQILKITGASPDPYRDYNFGRLIPKEIKSMAQQAKEIYDIANELYLITGTKGEHVATLNTVAALIERMASKEDEVARNLENFKTNLGTLGTWLFTSREQSLEIDYIMIQPKSAKLPKGDANFFEAAWFEIKAFVLSFFVDYTTMGSMSEFETNITPVDLWTSDGRDQAQILRMLIDYEFTPAYNIPVNLKLVVGGSLLPSILAGVGPDVTFLGSSDVINWAIRTAVERVDEFEDYEEVIKRFVPSAMIPLTLFGDDSSHVYGIPATMGFSMMFYRLDVFADLEIEVPNTYNEMLEILPALNSNKMEIGFPSNLGGTIQLMYQMGGSLYADNGKRVNLDSNIGLSAFNTICDLFSKYKFPLTYNPETRFRNGEMPLQIAGYGLYNTLIIYATELGDLWEMVPILGWENEKGEVDNCTTLGVSAIVLPRGAQNKDNAWRFMDWYTSAKAQSRYANELVAVLGPAGKHPTANMEAFAELPWTAKEYKALQAQMNNLVAVPEYPGGYIIARYVDFAFMATYNNNADPVESILTYMTDMNKEISRKRREFGWEAYDITYTTSFVEAVE